MENLENLSKMRIQGKRRINRTGHLEKSVASWADPSSRVAFEIDCPERRRNLLELDGGRSDSGRILESFSPLVWSECLEC